MPRKKSRTNTKITTALTISIVLVLTVSLFFTIWALSKPQSLRSKASENDLACQFEELTPVPDWLQGNSVLGSFKKRFPPGSQNDQWEEPGPVIQKGDEVATTNYKYDLSVDWRIVHGGKLPVAYDPWNDNVRGEFSGRSWATSNWSNFLRGMNDDYYGRYSKEMAAHQISLGVLMKYKIMSQARSAIDNLVDEKGGSEESAGTSASQSVKNLNDFYAGKLTVQHSQTILNHDWTRTNIDGWKIDTGLLNRVIGFDISEYDLRQTLGTQDEIKARMIAETASCPNIPASKPTSSVPVNCEEHLVVPPIGFRTDFPSYNKNLCISGGELGACGDYWVSGWCNNQGNATVQNTAMFACRGWSQVGEVVDNHDRFLLYYTNRVRTMSGDTLKVNISTYGDARGRKITFNSLMGEVLRGHIAFPYEHDSASKSPEEVRNNALQAASMAIFGKSWGAVVEQERMNNCSITGESDSGPSNPSEPVSQITLQPTYTPAPTLPNPVTPQIAANSMKTVGIGLAILGGAAAAWYLWPL